MTIIKWLLCIALLITAVVLLKLFGYLNPGNQKKNVTVKKKNSVLRGKNIIFLGSSVTKGMAAQGMSMVDMLSEAYGANVVKEAVSGTTLVDQKALLGESYITRMKKLDKSLPCDLFVCQLSTNDATKNKPLGEVGESFDINDFDTLTVCGAIEYVIAYAKEVWKAPIVFYTNPEYDSPAYKAMVEALKKIVKKWNISMIDLWNDLEVNNHKDFSHMNDHIHPTKKGYSLWTPIFEEALSAVIEGKPIPSRPKVIS